jgi:hypothetical protein
MTKDWVVCIGLRFHGCSSATWSWPRLFRRVCATGWFVCREFALQYVPLRLVYNVLSITRGLKGNVVSKHVKNFNSCLEFVTVGVKAVSHALPLATRLRQHLWRIVGMRGSRVNTSVNRGSKMACSFTSSRVMGVFLVLSTLYCLCAAERGKSLCVLILLLSKRAIYANILHGANRLRSRREI